MLLEILSGLSREIRVILPPLMTMDPSWIPLGVRILQFFMVRFCFIGLDSRSALFWPANVFRAVRAEEHSVLLEKTFRPYFAFITVTGEARSRLRPSKSFHSAPLGDQIQECWCDLENILHGKNPHQFSTEIGRAHV